MSKKLIAYFSASGVTKKAAAALAKATGADLHEIVPQVPYTKADLDWQDKQSRSTLEMQDKSSRPAIVKDSVNTAAYDVIFLGFPVWWYTAPTLMNTFLEAHDFSGKTVVLFATCGSSGFGSAKDDLAASLPADANVVEGKVLAGEPDLDALRAWAAELNL